MIGAAAMGKRPVLVHQRGLKKLGVPGAGHRVHDGELRVLRACQVRSLPLHEFVDREFDDGSIASA